MTAVTTKSIQPAQPQSQPRQGISGQFRFRYLAMGTVAIFLALITLLQAMSAYNTTYQLFSSIVQVNSKTVDAAESALQYIAQASQAAADYAVLTSDTPLYEQAQNNIFRDFSDFRDEMAILQGNLQSDDERTAYTVAETFTYSRFWRHVSNLVAQRSNDVAARREYLEADNHILNWINPALQELENLNYQQMVRAGETATGTIVGQVVGFAIPAILLAALTTLLSFRLRSKVRRYITPGIDAALILTYVLLAAILLQLLGAPNQINTMIDNAYQSVSASSRVLVDANLANRAESSALLDPARANAWFIRFDTAVHQIELRLCGQPDCTTTSFISGKGSLAIDVVTRATEISRGNSALIEGIRPLTGKASTGEEAAALEAARTAFIAFRSADDQLKNLIANGDAAGAVEWNTSTTSATTATSQTAFDRFVTAINQVIDINRTVFNDIWQQQSSALQNSRVLFGLVGYLLIAVLLGVGIWQRIREL